MTRQPADLVFNPYAFAVHDDPYETYRRLRDEAPAYFNDELRFWVLSRFDDVLNAFRDFETFSSAGGVALENRRPITASSGSFDQMIEMDPPDHTQFRKLVSRVFTGRRVATMEEEVRSIVNAYIDTVADQGQCDLVGDITGPFPMDVICAVLGIEPEHRNGIRDDADKILIREDGVMDIPHEAAEGMFGLLAFFQGDIDRRRTPSPNERSEGLISDLLELEVDGRALTEGELLGFCVLFAIAGHAIEQAPLPVGDLAARCVEAQGGGTVDEFRPTGGPHHGDGVNAGSHGDDLELAGGIGDGHGLVGLIATRGVGLEVVGLFAHTNLDDHVG